MIANTDNDAIRRGTMPVIADRLERILIDCCEMKVYAPLNGVPSMMSGNGLLLVSTNMIVPENLNVTFWASAMAGRTASATSGDEGGEGWRFHVTPPAQLCRGDVVFIGLRQPSPYRCPRTM